MKDLQELYELYFKDVYLYLLALSKDKELSEDLTADTFYKAAIKIDTFRGDSDIRVWLCSIAKNLYFNYLKRKKRFNELEFEPPQQKSIEQIIEDKESAARIHKIIHNMNEPYKEIFTLRTFGELSFKQIAELFGKTENWACVCYHRAKEKIMKELGD